jgi:hypothetical protein
MVAAVSIAPSVRGGERYQYRRRPVVALVSIPPRATAVSIPPADFFFGYETRESAPPRISTATFSASPRICTAALFHIAALSLSLR